MHLQVTLKMDLSNKRNPKLCCNEIVLISGDLSLDTDVFF